MEKEAQRDNVYSVYDQAFDIIAPSLTAPFYPGS